MIYYVKGDATQPIFEHSRIIAHVCNNVGAWGKGFVVSLGEKYPLVKQSYLHTGLRGEQYELGNVQFVETSILFRVVANMIAQDGLPSRHNPRPLNLEALALCLQKVNQLARNYGLTIHMPRIGTGYGGRDWETEILPLVEECLNVDVYVYDL